MEKKKINKHHCTALSKENLKNISLSVSSSNNWDKQI